MLCQEEHSPKVYLSSLSCIIYLANFSSACRKIMDGLYIRKLHDLIYLVYLSYKAHLFFFSFVVYWSVLFLLIFP